MTLAALCGGIAILLGGRCVVQLLKGLLESVEGMTRTMKRCLEKLAYLETRLEHLVEPGHEAARHLEEKLALRPVDSGRSLQSLGLCTTHISLPAGWKKCVLCTGPGIGGDVPSRWVIVQFFLQARPEYP